MNYLSNCVRQELKYVSIDEDIEINLDEINEGISQNESFIFSRKGKIISIFDRVCDHNGGRLSLKGNNAVCPLHGWKLDVEAGRYTNIKCSKEPLASFNEYELDSPYIKVPKGKVEMKTLEFETKKDLKIRFINHACLHFNIEDKITFATDPWVLGSAFSNGWWLSKDSPLDVFEVLNECDFIYISHNHPDHLHPQSLKHIRKDMPILTAGFQSESTVISLEQCGFTNITVMDFNSRLIDYSNEISVAVLKSGDFRDDSGLLIEIGEFKCLLTVDCNFINFGKLPSVDLLCSSFAGGASGFPLCFENYSEDEKEYVIRRNRGAIRATNIKTIQSVGPKLFMPYAGFFTEKASRDSYVNERNIKNSVEDYQTICEKNGSQLLNVNNDQIFKFYGKDLFDTLRDLSANYCDKSIASYLSNAVDITEDEISNLVSSYFENSGFNDSLVVDLISTDDTFTNVYERFSIDFSVNEFVTVDNSINGIKLEKITIANGNRYLQLKVRRSELVNVLLHGNPWEDLSIGFQCRIYRNPNVYNSDFWYHFTNVYITNRVTKHIAMLDT